MKVLPFYQCGKKKKIVTRVIEKLKVVLAFVINETVAVISRRLKSKFGVKWSSSESVNSSDLLWEENKRWLGLFKGWLAGRMFNRHKFIL